MKFKGSIYYDKNLLGKAFYENIGDLEEILTVQECFEINNKRNNYHIEQKYSNFNLKIYEDHYELDCSKYDICLYLVFDKPVLITGKYCSHIIAPEIIVRNSKNKVLSYCITNKLIIDNNYNDYYNINYSKIKDIYFYNKKVQFDAVEADIFFIFNKNLEFDIASYFLDYHKIKIFGKSSDLKGKILNDENFKKGIIHIE